MGKWGRTPSTLLQEGNGYKSGVPSSYVLVAYKDRNDKTGTPSNVVIVRTGALAAAGSLPKTGLYPTYNGVQLDGSECVAAARAYAANILKKNLPRLGAFGKDVSAYRFWDDDVAVPGFARVTNDGSNLPPPNALIIWNKKIGPNGHIAVALGTVDAKTRMVRVLDSNYHNPPDHKGRIHDVTIDDKVLGWLIPK